LFNFDFYELMMINSHYSWIVWLLVGFTATCAISAYHH